MKFMEIRVKTIWAVVFCAGVWACPVFAQTWDHVHLTVSDTAAAAAWYAKHFGGEVTKSGALDAVLFGTNLIKFNQADNEVLGSKGSSIDHIAFSVKDVKVKAEALRDDGAVKVDTGNRGGRRAKVVAKATDPWGTVLELIVDEDLLGFHHVHLKSQLPKTTSNWYTTTFGGVSKSYKDAMNAKAIRYNDMYLFVQASVRLLAPSNGRSADHIGWRFKDFDAMIKRLKSMDVKFLQEPVEHEGHRIAIIESPNGVKIEIIENTEM